MIFSISDAGRAFIKRREGLRLSPYQDAVGKWTIGYGHLMLPGEPRVPLRSELEASALFDTDAAPRERRLNELLTHPSVDQAIFDASASLLYNIGEHAFAGSSYLKDLNDGNLLMAAIDILDWSRAGTNADLLLLRRAKEVRMFTRGEYLS